MSKLREKKTDLWSKCIFPFCSELHCLPISYLTFYIKRHLFWEARSRVLVGFTLNSAKALSTVLGTHSRWMNQFGNCQNVGFGEGKDKWRPNAFIPKRKERKERKWKTPKLEKPGSIFPGAQAEPRETQLHHRQASVERSKQGEIIHNYRQSCFRG